MGDTSIVNAINNNTQTIRSLSGQITHLRTPLYSRLMMGAGIACINYVNIKHNKEYMKADCQKKEMIHINLSGWSLLKGIVYGICPTLSIAHMCYNILFSPQMFSKHLIPGYCYGKPLTEG